MVQVASLWMVRMRSRVIVDVCQPLLKDIHDLIHAVHDELPALVDLRIDVLLVLFDEDSQSVVVVAGSVERLSRLRGHGRQGNTIGR
jgi:hypothetical protein